MPWAYEQILLQYNASATSLVKAFMSPLMTEGWGRRALWMPTRSSFSAEIPRASTAAVIVGMGIPRSSAVCVVHLPVPFWPGFVEDHFDQIFAGAIGIGEIDHLGGDFDQEAFQHALFQERKTSFICLLFRPPTFFSRS
jgi:hypothetical protein